MSTLWISPELLQRMAGAILHFFWQGAFVAMLAAVVLRLLARRTAEWRYIVSIAALLLMFIAPVVTFVFYAQTGALSLRLLQFIADSFPAPGQSSGQSSGQASSTVAWTQWIVFAWLLGVVFCSLRLASGWRLSRRLLRLSNAAVPAFVSRIFAEIKERVKISKPIKLLVSEYIDSPSAVGWLRPAVLLPVRAITGLDEVQLRAVLAHEIAHIRRHDFIVNALQRCVESILFYHPAVWWLSARVRAEREHCCDDLAIQVCGDRLLYAQALIELERVRAAEPMFAVAATGGSLVMRVRRILGREGASHDWQAASAALLFVIAWMIAGAWQSTALIAEPLVALNPPPAPRLEFGPWPMATAVQAIAAIVTAQPLPPVETQPAAVLQVVPQNGRGIVHGTITRLGSADPVPNVQVTLAGGPADPKSVQDLSRAVAGRGIIFAPASTGTVDEVLQALADTASAAGVATNFPAMREAVANFRSANAARFSATSGDKGEFAIPDVLPGQYAVQAQREGFFEPPAMPKVTVGSNQTVTVAFSIIAGATVSGRIRTASGQPVRNVDVQALGMRYQNGYPELFPVITKTPDDRGDFRLFWLEPGEYFLAVSPRQTPGGQNANAPRQQFARTFYPNTSEFRATVPLRIKGGEQLPGMDIELQTMQGVKISGKITTSIPPEESSASGDRIGVPQMVMMMYPHDPNAPDVTGNGNAARTPPNLVLNPTTGDFTAAGVPPGSYDLYARIPESNANGGAGLAFGAVAIDVRSDDIDGLSLMVGRTVPVTGVVTVDGNSPQGNTIRVMLQPDGKKPGVYGSVAARPVPANPDGTFSIIAVPAGRYRVQAGPGLPPDLYLADVLQGASVLDSGFDVGLQSPNPIRVMFKSGAATVEGTVQDARGRAVPDATVVLVPPPARRENRGLYRTVTSDPSGRFTMRNVAPGEYKLFAWDGVTNGAHFNAGFLSKYESRGRRVAVNEKSTAAEQITVISTEP